MSLAKLLLQWYQENKRVLPWRDIKDPYKIWLSEIMLQQTRIQQVYDYYERFTNQWKTIEELAKATEEEVFKAWEGLGYYSRAKNLHQTAKQIVNHYNGNFPHTYQELMKLPGIGAYTARAIASFAFLQPVVSLDGNAFRVITRVLDIDLPIHQSKNQKIIQKQADELLENASSKDFNYALMDLGNLVCKPFQPSCEICPLQSKCLAFHRNTQLSRPNKLKNLKRSIDFLVYFWFENQNKVCILKKNASYWKGLYVLPFLKLEENQWKNFDTDLIYETKHILTHKDLFIKIIKSEKLPFELENVEWIKKSDLIIKPFPKPLQNFIEFMNV